MHTRTEAYYHLLHTKCLYTLIITNKIPCIMNKCLACKETEITNSKSNRLYTHYDKQGKHTVDSEKVNMSVKIIITPVYTLPEYCVAITLSYQSHPLHHKH